MITTSLRKSVAVVVSLLLLLLATAVSVQGGQGGSSSSCGGGRHHFRRDDAVKLTRSKLYRFRQQCKREKLRKRRGQFNRQREKALQTPGSFLSLSMPTPERVSRWFGGGKSGVFCGQRRRGGGRSSSTSTLASERRIVFNHDTVGMTNPCLHVRDNDVDFVAAGKEELLQEEQQSHTQHDPCRSNNDDDVDESNSNDTTSGSNWWPSCAWLEQQQQQQDASSSSSSSSSTSSWRVLRYRRQVGIGNACYEKTKEAALAWEFADRNNRQGLLSVIHHPATNNKDHRHYNYDDCDDESRFNTIRLGPGYRVLSLPAEGEQVENDVSSLAPPPSLSNVVGTTTSKNNEQENASTMIWSQGGRQLATFTRSPYLRFLFAVNPVAVVYDIVDQQGGPDGATKFTSTAFSTCKGHWFRGEERVTVALRKRRPNGCSAGVLPQQQQQQGKGIIQLPSTTIGAAADHDDDDGGVVDVEILSISKPSNSIMGRVAWALSSRLQHRFFVAQLDALERQAKQQHQQQQQQDKANK